LWFPLCRFPSKAVLTAPTSQQLFDALWSELRRWLGEAPAAVQDLLEVYNDRMHLKSAPEQAFVSARTSRAETPEAIQGVHSSNVLLIVDEASGVPEQVFEAGSGSMSTPGAITVLAGNPLRSSGFFWRTHNDLAASWVAFRVSAADSPRVDPKWVKEQADSYGVASAYYQARVLGEFPMNEDEVLIPRSLVVPACERALPSLSRNEYATAVWGLDLARFGSASSVLIKRIGNSVPEPPQVWRAVDLMHIVGAVKVDFESLPPDMRPSAICVDSIGMGAGVADRMTELGLPTVFVNVSESPAVSGRYYRLRDELYGRTRDWFEKRDCSIPRHDRLVNELTSIRYRFTSDGRLRVESKDEMKKRGLASPDVADAFSLTFGLGSDTAIGYNSTDRRRFQHVEETWVV
ncbi:MAG TPA: hypothetical protein VFB50_16960, partial [Chloroflexota bacterium]|nr:hypothetical protein [Chloroflexota bacterium]